MLLFLSVPWFSTEHILIALFDETGNCEVKDTVQSDGSGRNKVHLLGIY